MARAIPRPIPARHDYDPRHLRADLLAGLTVAIVALPLALGFGITSGAGAGAGLATAIVAGVVAALFGGSDFQVSGPTGAMTVVLLPIVARYGVEVLPLLGLLAGIVLLALAFARVGRYIHFIPWPVITGFTNGIAVIIFLQQLPGFLGVAKGAGESILTVSWHTLRGYAAAPSAAPVILGLLAVAVTAGWSRLPRRLAILPGSMAALLAVTLISLLPPFEAVPRVGLIPAALPLPTLPDLSFGLGEFTDLVRAALAVAVLSALESLLSAVVADGMTIGSRHDPDRELYGQGLANIASALFGGIPATAALARTAVNVRSGARTRLAAITHGLVLLLIVLFLAPIAGRIPLAALAGILMVVAVRMVERHALRRILLSSKSDAFVLLVTTFVTIAFDLILAIEVGMVAAAVLFIVRMSSMFSVAPDILAASASSDTAPAAPADPLGRRMVAYRIDGPLFFGAANRFFDQLLKLDPEVETVILRMRRVPVMDATGATALQTLAEQLERRRIELLFSGLQPQPERILRRMGILPQVSRGGRHLFATTDEAIAYARQRLADDAGAATDP